MEFTVETALIKSIMSILSRTVSVAGTVTINTRFSVLKKKDGRWLVIEMVGEKAYGKTVLKPNEVDWLSKDMTPIVIDGSFIQSLPDMAGNYEFRATDDTTLTIRNKQYTREVGQGGDESWNRLKVSEPQELVIPIESATELIGSIPSACTFAESITTFSPDSLVRISINGKEITIEATDSHSAFFRRVHLSKTLGKGQILVPADWLATWPHLIRGGKGSKIKLLLSSEEEDSCVAIHTDRWKIVHALPESDRFKDVQSIMKRRNDKKFKGKNDLVVFCPSMATAINMACSCLPGDPAIELRREEKVFSLFAEDSQARSSLNLGKVGESFAATEKVEIDKEPIKKPGKKTEKEEPKKKAADTVVKGCKNYRETMRTNRTAWDLVLKAGSTLVVDKTLRLRSDGRMVFAEDGSANLIVATTEVKG